MADDVTSISELSVPSTSQGITSRISTSKKRKVPVQTSVLSHLIRPISLQRQHKINDIILDMIVKDLEPVSVVTRRGFKALIAGFEPSYVMPSRSTFTNSFLPQKYNEQKEKLKALLSKTNSVCITTDAWTASNNQSSYIGYTCHFITEEWILYSCLLECGQYDESHTAQHLRDELFRVMNEWDISEKVIAVTTDNAANIKAAIKLTGWGHVGCFAQTLNLIIQSGLDLESVAPVRQKVKATVEYFHRSTKTNNKFLPMQKQLNENVTPLKLKNDVLTRWNSTFFMFERFLKTQEALKVTVGILNSPVELLTEVEWLLLKEICSILKPFEQITTEMSAEKNVTLSKVIIIVKGLQLALQKMKDISTNSQAKALICHYENELLRRFAAVETNHLMSKCAILDPRFKSKVFSSDLNFNMAKERLEKDVTRLINLENQKNNAGENLSIAQDVTDDEEDNLIWSDFDKLVKKRKEIDPKATAILEVRSYLAEELIHRKEDPLKWWKIRAAVYPNLSKLAMQNLCIIATSVPSERVFSKAGQLISEKRSQLKGENVKKKLFLNYNEAL